MNEPNKPLNIPGVKISPATEGCLLGIPVYPWNATAHGAMLYALLKRTEALEAMLAEYLVIEFESNSIRVPTFGKAWWIADDEDTQKVGDRLVELGLWEKHPTHAKHYRRTA